MFGTGNGGRCAIKIQRRFSAADSTDRCNAFVKHLNRNMQPGMSLDKEPAFLLCTGLLVQCIAGEMGRGHCNSVTACRLGAV